MWSNKQGRSIDSKIRNIVMTRDRWLCQIRWNHWCEGKANEIDHIIRVVDGGSDHPSNLQASCGYCNAKRNYSMRVKGNRQSRSVKKNPGLIG